MRPPMNVPATGLRSGTDVFGLLPAVLLTAVLGLVLWQDYGSRHLWVLLIGVGLGVTLLHGAYGFSGAWRRFIREGEGVGVRSNLLLFAVTSLLFFPLLGGAAGAELHPALGPVGVSVAVGAFLFGIGMQLGGGCGSGTLFAVGGGNVRMLLTLVFFVAGSLVGTAHLPWWTSLPGLGRVSLIQSFGWAPALAGQLLVLAGLYGWVLRRERARRGRVWPLLASEPGQAPVAVRLLRGPWPLWWAVAGLALLNLATLWVAGHPWTITFAFGLWGAKVLAALGGEPAGWTYWSSGYAARALQDSVLADVTSLMDFGIILGAMLAAGLAGRYAPAVTLNRAGVVTAVTGGLLMGYGARLAFGCNIGGLTAGLVSGSLHGWLWMVTGFAGAVVGVRARAWLGLDAPGAAR